MNIFTNDDYRRIQAWLKANAIKDSDFTISENTVPDEDILVITQNVSTIPTNYRIKIKDLLNSSLGKIVIDKITANVVKVNNTLTVDAANVKLDNEKGTTLQDIIDWTETIEKVAKEWNIEYQVPSIDEPTVRAKYVLKDSKGVPKGDVIKVYKDSAITNVYLGTTKDTCNEDTGEVTKKPVQDNNEALSIVYRLDTGKYSLVNVPIGIFTREAEFDKYKGLGVTENGQVFIKLASDVESSNYLHFNDIGEVSADGIENRILQDLGTIINSVANDGTMWGQYKKEEGTKDSPINEASRWGQYKQAEADRSELLNIVSSKVNQLEQEQIQGGVYDVTTHNDGAVFESLSSLLSSSNLDTLIPISVRHGGISIRFVQSSDNKYVQYRLTTNEWSNNTEDWAIYSESVYVENPEFIYVKVDKDDKILWAIKTDGSIYYGAGVPQQVKDYINEKIRELSLDEYEDIVKFLGDYLGSDTTLKIMIEEINAQNATKVDKVESKSLIDADYASSQSAVDSSEYLQVITDSEDKILEGITSEGVKQISIPIDTPSATIEHVENPEFISVITDKEGRLISGRTVKGVLKENVGIETENMISKKTKSSEVFFDSAVGVDIRISGITNISGTVTFEQGIPAQIKDYIDSNKCISEKLYELTAQSDNIINLIGIDTFKEKVVASIFPGPYNCWPIIGKVNEKIICLYTQGVDHETSKVGSIYSTLSKNGIVWTPKQEIINTLSNKDGVTGAGNDNDGNFLVWNRVGMPWNPLDNELYKSTDGFTFTKIASVNLYVNNVFVQPMDIIQVPTVGLVSFFHTYGDNRSWGFIYSADNGENWNIHIVEQNIPAADCPVEISAAYIGDGKIIAIGRYDVYNTENPRLWQLQSADYGETWTKVATNISGAGNTSAILYNVDTEELSHYVYLRSTGQLQYRKVSISDIWDNPTNWPIGRTIAQGTIGQDAGNVKAISHNGYDVVMYYSGDSQNTGIYSLIV